jgi:hypothetical protein
MPCRKKEKSTENLKITIKFHMPILRNTYRIVLKLRESRGALLIHSPR